MSQQWRGWRAAAAPRAARRGVFSIDLRRVKKFSYEILIAIFGFSIAESMGNRSKWIIIEHLPNFGHP